MRTTQVFVLILAIGAVLQPDAVGTTCVPLKAIKVKNLCGKISNLLNEPVADGEVDLVNPKSKIVKRTASDRRGYFYVPNSPEGQYMITVRAEGYQTAAREIVITNPGNSVCRRPLHVSLSVAGCSFVGK
jgi:hypothetical protein